VAYHKVLSQHMLEGLGKTIKLSVSGPTFECTNYRIPPHNCDIRISGLKISQQGAVFQLGGWACI
jgi:hypothetical protein